MAGGLRPSALPRDSGLCSAKTIRAACLLTSDAISTGAVSSPHVLSTALVLLADLLRLLRLMFRSRRQLAAENLFLRKQMACYIERQVRPRHTDNASRIGLVLLSQFVDWRELLTIVRPGTLVRWHRDLFRLFWRLKSRRRGRPRIPADVQRLIAEMATNNRIWGEERIAAELRVKLGLTLSPRTVRRYMPSRPRSRGGQSTQSWTTLLHNHAGAVLACDSSSWSRPPFNGCTSSFSLTSPRGGSCIGISLTTLRQNGLSSSSATVCLWMTSIACSSTIVTASSRQPWTRPYGRCRSRC